MAVLNSWQKIDRVIPGKPFGDGADGDVTISSNQTQSQTKVSCSGNSGSNTLTVPSTTGFAAGDLVLIHQVRGTGVGQWEWNKIDSVGAGQFTLNKTLQYTYTDSGASQAQVIKVPRYKTATINADVAAPNWDGDTGGWVLFVAQTSIGGTGSLTCKGNHGNATGGDGARGIGAGFEGGIGRQGQNAADYAEGTAGARAQSGSGSPNGNGGGGGKANGGSNNGGGGGGGGHRIAGGNSSTAGAGGQYAGQGGSSAGAADLTTLVFGGGGGGAGNGATESNGAGGGGSGAGAIMLVSKDINVSGFSAINLNGGNGGNGWRGGGGAAGGSCLLVGQTITIGTNKITALYGQSGGNGNGGNGGGNATGEGANTSSDSHGGNGSNGRVAIHYKTSVSGSSNPVSTDTQDATLVELLGGGAFLYNVI